MGRETSVATRNMQGLPQNGEATESAARKSGLTHVFGLVSLLNRRFGRAPFMAIQKSANFSLQSRHRFFNEIGMT
jgi:hypothetical protein